MVDLFAQVIAVIGWVPIEEYAFFSLQTALLGALWLNEFPSAAAMQRPPREAARRAPHRAQLIVRVTSLDSRRHTCSRCPSSWKAGER